MLYPLSYEGRGLILVGGYRSSMSSSRSHSIKLRVAGQS